MRSRAIYGCAGTELTDGERGFFADAQPWGFILFARNIADRDQVRALVATLARNRGRCRRAGADRSGRRARGAAEAAAVDRRVRPPRVFGALHAQRRESRARGRLSECAADRRTICASSASMWIACRCWTFRWRAPTTIIGDRAYGRDAGAIIDLGRAVIEGMIEGGVLPVMKHVPGHGRAKADSHLALPRVDTPAEELSATDFVTFRSLNQCPLAMTAHVVYEAIDPQRPATTSPKVIRDVIRGEIGFDGVLLSDDLSMNALDGPLSVRAKAALFAGCDIVLHCNGRMDEMREVAGEAKPLEGRR